MNNPYKIFGISRTADQSIARNRYIQLAKQYHPDTSKFNVKYSEAKMKEINNAYNVIKLSISRGVLAFRPKGRFTKEEIRELIQRFSEGQSLYKIGRDMKRKQRSIKKHLISAGLMEEEIYIYDVQDGTFNIFYLIAKYTLLFLTITSLFILNQGIVFWIILMSLLTYFIIDL